MREKNISDLSLVRDMRKNGMEPLHTVRYLVNEMKIHA